MSNITDDHYVDTNVVIEASRTQSMEALAHNYPLVTVDKVIEECGTGSYDSVNIEALRAQVRAHTVASEKRAKLRLALMGRVSLDPGEEELLAEAMTNPGAWKICSPDGALVRACHLLKCLDHVVSLESMLKAIGHVPKLALKFQYSEKWLIGKRTDFALEDL